MMFRFCLEKVEIVACRSSQSFQKFGVCLIFEKKIRTLKTQNVHHPPTRNFSTHIRFSFLTAEKTHLYLDKVRLEANFADIFVYSLNDL